MSNQPAETEIYDRFATIAMQELLACVLRDGIGPSMEAATMKVIVLVPAAAYDIADKMMAERGKRHARHAFP